MKPREYCCCAIPTVNAGIYATLAEQLMLAFIVGTLSIATPHIVGAATPSFAPWILAIICYVGAGVQVFGIIGVAKEKSILYRRYVTLHILVTVIAFSVSIVWIIISASRHSAAQIQCEKDFFQDGDKTLSEGEILCSIFSWVDVGLMGGLWVFFAITQFYFYIVVSAYGTSQRQDHEKYDALPSPTQPLKGDIPMTNRADSWDSRPPDGGSDRREFGHARQESNASVNTVLGDQLHQPVDFHSNVGYGAGYGQGVYPPAGNATARHIGGYDQDVNPNRHRNAPSYPADVYTQEPGPTPNLSDNYHSISTNNLEIPTATHAHPAEGSFRRKTPRITKPDPSSIDFDRGFFSTGRT